MQIDITWKPDTPLSMALNIVSEMAELATLFDAGTVKIMFSDGEEERLSDVERNRAKRIS